MKLCFLLHFRVGFVETKEASNEGTSKTEEEPKISEAEQKLMEEKEKLAAQVADFTVSPRS